MSSPDWDVRLYDDKHHFVTQYGQGLIDLLKPQPGERILDVGCGTGHLTKQIHDMGADVVGIDASEAMIDEARRLYPDLQFEQKDASDFEFDEPFDGIFSNAALHWVTNAEGAARCMSAALRQGGRFVIEMGGHGNVKTIIEAFFAALKDHGCNSARHCWYFPSIGEYSTLLEQVRIEPTAVWLFDRPTPLEGQDGIRNWIKMFGEGFHADVDSAAYEKAIDIAQNLLRPTLLKDGVWYADYRRLRVVAVKR